MDSENTTSTGSKKMLWAGWIASAIPVAMLILSGVMKLLKPEPVVEGFEHLGWPASLALALGIVELVSTALYVVPRTAVLGAILLTGYLGGAIATHVRIGEGFIGPAAFGVLVWLGLYLRDARIREILPLR
ncbi:DoxX family protein [Bythopirellula goksoeyrii]|uniref:DoxX n=1 Tax=Bythopirellula goksoeyrii TaxID=1400387 RepID=A0A5B9QH06_9BACT|nr:DoxX family protein [Bythopirellula goksoeyrii]QEG33533.1 hypothetical protein Pr1d_07970 [Bythopirellula goksoeyrii]